MAMKNIMSPQEDNTQSQNPNLGLGLTITLGFPLIALLSQSKTLKTLIAAVAATEGAIKGSKVLTSLPSISTLFLASKAISKSYKAARILRPDTTPSLPLTEPAKKQLKAALGAVNLVKYLVLPSMSEGVLGLGIFKFGYKVSKNFAKVLEGFIGLQIDKSVIDGVDALGVIVKTVGIVWDFAILIKNWCGLGCEEEKRIFCCCCLVHSKWRRRVRLSLDRLDPMMHGVLHRECKQIDVEFEMVDERWCGSSELLCLSIPISMHEGMPVSCA